MGVRERGGPSWVWPKLTTTTEVSTDVGSSKSATTTDVSTDSGHHQHPGGRPTRVPASRARELIAETQVGK